MKNLLILLIGVLAGSIGGGAFVYTAVAKNRFELGYNSGHASAQIEIANKIGNDLGIYQEGKDKHVDTLYQVKDMSVVIIEKDGVKSLRLW